MVIALNLGDVLSLKKPHPCSSSQWEVVRLGADIGLRCLGCSRQVMLPRPILERRVKAIAPAQSRASPGS